MKKDFIENKNNLTVIFLLTGADRVNRYHVVEENNTGTTGRWKVSAKIQQLLNTLKRPKRRPLPEFYEDDDIELEIAANPKDPNAPKPEGGTMTPAVGEQLSVPSGLPRSVEASIQRSALLHVFFLVNALAQYIVCKKRTNS